MAHPKYGNTPYKDGPFTVDPPGGRNNQPPPPSQPPPSEPPPPAGGGDSPGDGGGLLGIPDIIDSVTNLVGTVPGLVGDLVDALPDADIGTNGLLDIELNNGGLSVGVGGEEGLPLISLDSETDATIQVPVFGEDGIVSGDTALGGIVGGDDGLPLISLDSEKDATLQVPVFGEVGIVSGDTALDGIVGGGDGLPLISLDSEKDATLQFPIVGEDGILNGGNDLGSLLNAAMLDIGNGGALGGILGGDAYDGNVPLAGDLASALGSTLDLLTTTSSLFDVPALDILGGDGMDG